LIPLVAIVRGELPACSRGSLAITSHKTVIWEIILRDFRGRYFACS
jgi:hypothetical protein